MPTIRIDDEVFKALQMLAEPFTDTPNTVIKRLLAERTNRPSPGADRSPESSPSPVRAPSNPVGGGARTALRGQLTPQPVYEQALLHVLGQEFGGRGGKHEVTAAVMRALKQLGFINAQDLQRVSSGETRAENTIAWARNALKDRGLIRNDSARGVWELTPKGVDESRNTPLPYADASR